MGVPARIATVTRGPLGDVGETLALLGGRSTGTVIVRAIVLRPSSGLSVAERVGGSDAHGWANDGAPSTVKARSSRQQYHQSSPGS